LAGGRIALPAGRFNVDDQDVVEQFRHNS
jgi:hypothetical protein